MAKSVIHNCHFLLLSEVVHFDQIILQKRIENYGILSKDFQQKKKGFTLTACSNDFILE